MSDKLIEKRDAVLAEMRTLAESDQIDQEAFDALDAEVQDINKRIAVLDAYTRGGATEHGDDRSGAPQFMKRVNTDIDVRHRVRTGSPRCGARRPRTRV